MPGNCNSLAGNWRKKGTFCVGVCWLTKHVGIINAKLESGGIKCGARDPSFYSILRSRSGGLLTTNYVSDKVLGFKGRGNIAYPNSQLVEQKKPSIAVVSVAKRKETENGFVYSNMLI